jgi:outer membrane protein
MGLWVFVTAAQMFMKTVYNRSQVPEMSSLRVFCALATPSRAPRGRTELRKGEEHWAASPHVPLKRNQDTQQELKEFAKPMKRSLTLVCMLASTLGAGALAQTAAEPPSAPGAAASIAPAGPTKIAVIQFEGVVAQTNEGQRAFAELNSKYQPKQTQIKTESDEVDTLKKDLQTAGDKLSDTERQTRLRTIDEKEKTLQRNVEDARNDFSSEMNEKFSAIAQKVAAVMAKYAQDNGYTVVLDAGGSQQSQSPILWAAESTNISEAVVQAYNKQSGVPPQPTATAAPRTTGTTTRTPARAPATTTHTTH